MMFAVERGGGFESSTARKKKDSGGDIQSDGICGNIEERGDL